MKLLDTTGKGNTKIYKTMQSFNKPIRIAQLSMMPSIELCPSSDIADCYDNCLKFSGLAAVYDSINIARQAKTDFWLNDQEGFLKQLIKELTNFDKLCSKLNVLGVVRLNVLSDIQWEKFNIPQQFPNLFFYDYTKLAKRLGNTPINYKLMFSYSADERYRKQVDIALESNSPITVVFNGKFPKTFLNRQVIDGDKSDIDNVMSGKVIIGLKVKGKQAKQSNSKFIVNSNDLIAMV